MAVDERKTDVDLLASVAPRHWAPIVFGVVPAGANRRRPSDIVRVFLAAFVVVIAGIGANHVAVLEKRVFELIADLPDWIHEFSEFWFKAATYGTLTALLLALLLARRFRLVLVLAVAGALGWLAAVGLRSLVDVDDERHAAGLVLDGTVPKHPVALLAITTTMLFVAGPYLLRPARRLVFFALGVAAFGAIFGLVGLPDDVVASIALGWGVAAALHLAIGTPAATPTLAQVSNELLALGVTVSDLAIDPHQQWGESRFVATAPDGGAISVEVIGRDATDARLFAKVGRSIWYKDSGPALALTRSQQLEHRAYLLLLADRAGVPVSEVVIAGVAGKRETALLVLREAEGTPLDQVDAAEITDAVLDNAWQNLARLHRERVAHGSMGAANVRLRADGTTAFVDFSRASSTAPPERLLLDRVELLVTTAAIVGPEHAFGAAQRALGPDGLADMLPMLEPQALSAGARHDVANLKPLLKDLREQGALLTGEEAVTLTELRRVSPTDILMAAGAILGVYLLIGELADVDFQEVFDTAEWGWVFVAFCLSFLPPFSSSISM
ncbi:MAG TPA: hypothetical protein VFX21_09600, partial [Acidimicrobiia bacterium]|nr:hypothetical protein [Acidimicrobiia bacterium]